MKIIVQHDDGTEEEITEGVQIAYDIAYGSLDWGSGFLDTEEMEAVARLAEACRFPSFGDALESARAAREEQEQEDALRAKMAKEIEEANQREAEHRAAVVAQMRRDEPELDIYTDDELLQILRNRKHRPGYTEPLSPVEKDEVRKLIEEQPDLNKYNRGWLLKLAKMRAVGLA